MADNSEVMKNIDRVENVTYSALTPNLKGFEAAVCTCCDLPLSFDTQFTKQTLFFTTHGKKTLGNIVGKGGNAGNQHFLLFPQSCMPYYKN